MSIYDCASSIAVFKQGKDNKTYLVASNIAKLDWAIRRQEDCFWISQAQCCRYDEAHLTRSWHGMTCLPDITQVDEQEACMWILHIGRLVGKMECKSLTGLQDLRSELRRLIQAVLNN